MTSAVECYYSLQTRNKNQHVQTNNGDFSNLVYAADPFGARGGDDRAWLTKSPGRLQRTGFQSIHRRQVNLPLIQLIEFPVPGFF